MPRSVCIFLLLHEPDSYHEAEGFWKYLEKEDENVGNFGIKIGLAYITELSKLLQCRETRICKIWHTS